MGVRTTSPVKKWVRSRLRVSRSFFVRRPIPALSLLSPFFLRCGGNFVDGLFGEDSIHYYAERAKGGQGLIIIGNTRVSKGTAFWPYCDPQLFNDDCIGPLRKVADEVHKYGAKLFIQIFYGAAERTYELQENSIYEDPDIELATLGPSHASKAAICVQVRL